MKPKMAKKEIVMIDSFSAIDKSKTALPQLTNTEKNNATDTAKHYMSNKVVDVFGNLSSNNKSVVTFFWETNLV